MKTKTKIAAAALAVMLLAGCSPISSGTIESKDSGGDYYYTTMQCSYYNAKGLCQIWIPVQNYAPPWWSFNLVNRKGDKGWVYVTEDTWNNYSVGQFYESGGKR